MDMDGLKDSVVRMLAGINYNKKTKKHECVIEEMQKSSGSSEQFLKEMQELSANINALNKVYGGMLSAMKA